MLHCDNCPAYCCRYVSVEIDAPTTLDDFDEIKWMVMHENVTVYKDNEGDWIVNFRTRCKNLKHDTLCGIYETRPQMCRDHSMKSCEVNGSGKVEVILFREPEEVERYLDKRFRRKKPKAKKIIANPALRVIA